MRIEAIPPAGVVDTMDTNLLATVNAITGEVTFDGL